MADREESMKLDGSREKVARSPRKSIDCVCLDVTYLSCTRLTLHNLSFHDRSTWLILNDNLAPNFTILTWRLPIGQLLLDLNFTGATTRFLRTSQFKRILDLKIF